MPANIYRNFIVSGLKYDIMKKIKKIWRFDKNGN